MTLGSCKQYGLLFIGLLAVFQLEASDVCKNIHGKDFNQLSG